MGIGGTFNIPKPIENHFLPIYIMVLPIPLYESNPFVFSLYKIAAVPPIPLHLPETISTFPLVISIGDTANTIRSLIYKINKS